MALIQTVQWNDSKDRTLVLRSCDIGDGALSIQFLRTVAAETHFTNNTVDRKFSTPEEIDRSWATAQNSPNEVRLGVFDGLQMVGQLFCARTAPGHPYIGHIAHFGMMVLRDYWGSGAANGLMRGMEEFVIAKGIVRVEAVVRSDNARGRSFYKKHGFSEEGTRVRSAFIDNKWIDDIYIGKIYGRGVI